MNRELCSDVTGAVTEVSRAPPAQWEARSQAGAFPGESGLAGARHSLLP